MSSAFKALTELSPTARDALNREAPPLFLQRMETNLDTLRTAALKAQVDVKRGQPEKIQKKEIAWEVARYFHYRTGKKPTVTKPPGGKARGDFLELLTTVFTILGVEGGGEAQANEVSGEWDQRPQL